MNKCRLTLSQHRDIRDAELILARGNALLSSLWNFRSERGIYIMRAINKPGLNSPIGQPPLRKAKYPNTHTICLRCDKPRYKHIGVLFKCPGKVNSFFEPRSQKRILRFSAKEVPGVCGDVACEHKFSEHSKNGCQHKGCKCKAKGRARIKAETHCRAHDKFDPQCLDCANYWPVETIDHPQHYGGDTVYETIKVLEAWLPKEQFIGFLRGNIIKYQSRADKKDGNEAYNKATWYSHYLTDFLKRS